MGVVREAVLRFELAKGVAVGHGQVIIPADHGLESGLPPGELKLGGHRPGGHLTLGEVSEQFAQAMLAHVFDQEGPLRQSFERPGVGNQRVQPLHKIFVGACHAVRRPPRCA